MRALADDGFRQLPRQSFPKTFHISVCRGVIPQLAFRVDTELTVWDIYRNSMGLIPGGKMSTVATRFTKFQVGAAAAAITAATVLTPAAIAPTMAYASPTTAPFMEAIGDSVSSLVDPVVTLAAVSPCATSDFAVGCYAVEGIAAGTQSIVRGAVVLVGTVAYVVAAGTGQLFKLLGSFIPGPVGALFTSVGDGVLAFANTIAVTFQVGPYQTAQ